MARDSELDRAELEAEQTIREAVDEVKRARQQIRALRAGAVETEIRLERRWSGEERRRNG